MSRRRCATGLTAALAVLVLVTVASLNSAPASASASAPATTRATRLERATESVWKLTRRPKARRAEGRVVRGPNGDGEVEVRTGTHWSAPMAVTDAGVQVNIGGVSCVTATFCGAYSDVDLPGTHTPEREARTQAFAFNGQAWIPSKATDEGAIVAIACPAIGACLAVAGGVERDALIFSGGTWRAEEHRSLPNVTRVACASAHFCAAVNGEGETRFFTLSTTGAPLKFSAAPGPAESAADLSVLLYRGAGVATINSLSCPAVGFCVAVGTLGSRAQHFGPHTFYAVLRHSAWSTRIALPQAAGRSGTGLVCSGVHHCVLPLTAKTALISADPFTVPRHPARLPALPGLPTVSSERLTNTPSLPALRVTVHAGAGRVTSVNVLLYGVFSGGDEEVFYANSTDPSVQTADIRVTAGTRQIAFTVAPDEGNGLTLVLKHSAPTVTLSLGSPVLYWQSTTLTAGLQPPDRPHVQLAIFNSQDTYRELTRVVKVTP